MTVDPVLHMRQLGALSHKCTSASCRKVPATWGQPQEHVELAERLLDELLVIELGSDTFFFLNSHSLNSSDLFAVFCLVQNIPE